MKMALVNSGIKAVTERMPKVISPKTHAIIDYATAATFFAGAAMFWKNHKRAAIASLVCGAAEFGTVLMTDIPGGAADFIDLDTHLKIDAGLAAGLQTLPTLLGFGGDPRAWFFRAQGMSIGAVAGLTERQSSRQPRRRRKAA
jgi:hypothetical protein